MDLAASWRDGIRRQRPSDCQARLLTGLWLAWTWAERARTDALNPAYPLGRSLWMLSYASTLVDLLLSGPETAADSLMGLILLGGATRLSVPATQARYAAWVLDQAERWDGPRPVPYRPRPGRYAPWYVVLYYRLLGRRKTVRRLHALLRLRD